jgi:hypothetical protein
MEATVPDDIDRDVVALVRAFAHGDRDGARVLLEANDPLHLVAALAAWVNLMGAEQAGSPAAWDDHLGRCLAGTVESP